MPATKLDANLFESPAALDAGMHAMYLHVVATAYCCRYQTDGIIGRDAVRRIISPDAILADLGLHEQSLNLRDWRFLDQAEPADDLVRAGLWEHCDGGDFRIVDYLKHHRSRAVLAEQRAARQEAGRKGGRAPRKGEAQ